MTPATITRNQEVHFTKKVCLNCNFSSMNPKLYFQTPTDRKVPSGYIKEEIAALSGTPTKSSYRFKDKNNVNSK